MFTQDRNNKRVFTQIKLTTKYTRQGIRRGMFKIGNTLVSDANRQILKGDKTGRVYIRRDKIGRRRRHQASAPGETHANMTGKLRRSLGFQLKGSDEIEFGYGVSSGKDAPDYAGYVEFGTTKMKARPSLKNSLRAERGNMIQHLEEEINKAFK